MNTGLRRMACIGLTIALGALAPACQPQDRAPAKPRVALIMKSLANEFFKTMEEGARAYAAGQAEAFELVVNGTQSEEDVAGQVTLVEQMMAQGVDAIVIAPADSQALVAVLDRAQKQGIVVVNIDNRLDAALLKERGLRVPFVGPDNRAGARLAAEYLAQRLAPGDAVAILEGIPSAYNAIERKRGFEEGMAQAQMKIVASQSANWEMAQANRTAAGILNEHPEVKALLCSNDNMALGAFAALKEAGRAAEVHLVGFDNIEAVQDLVRAGSILCTVDQHGDQLAVYGIQFAVRMLTGEVAPEDQETPIDLITQDRLSAVTDS